VAGISQVFLMLSSGGEPLQLTSDEGEKVVSSFSSDGTEIYYQAGRNESWAVPTLGGTPRRVAVGVALVPSADGESLYFLKGATRSVFRTNKSGGGEEKIYSFDKTAFPPIWLLPFPTADHLLVLTSDPVYVVSSSFHVYDLDVPAHTTVDLGEVLGNPFDIVWGESGKTVLFSRTVSGLTNIWKYNLKDKTLTQVSTGTGPDTSPMPDPGGKGIYFVNGKSMGILTTYNVAAKQFTDIASQNATQPTISPDGKRLMYVTILSSDRSELWVSNIDGSGKVKLATGGSLGTANWAPDGVHLAFLESVFNGSDKLFTVSADGSGKRQVPWDGGTLQNALWTPDQKALYLNVVQKGATDTQMWRENVDGTNAEKILDGCGFGFAVAPGGQYLLNYQGIGATPGIYEYSLVDRKCTLLTPDVQTFGITMARDGKSYMYAVPGQKDVTIYRQGWSDGKLVGAATVALKLPFAFPLLSAGNAYDLSSDLSTVIYARLGGHADLFLLSQK
jgi:Tol biopolymer transport system component